MSKQYTVESWMIANGKSGQVFFSLKRDTHITAIATRHSRKIITERIIAVTTAKAYPNAYVLTKVTLL